MDILDAYTLVNNEEGHLGPFDIEEAKRHAGGDVRRIWFVRDGHVECECTDENWEDCECELEPEWTVEPWRGQFVNCLGFFVSKEKRKPEHDDTIFTY